MPRWPRNGRRPNKKVQKPLQMSCDHDGRPVIHRLTFDALLLGGSLLIAVLTGILILCIRLPPYTHLHHTLFDIFPLKS